MLTLVWLGFSSETKWILKVYILFSGKTHWLTDSLTSMVTYSMLTKNTISCDNLTIFLK